MENTNDNIIMSDITDEPEQPERTVIIRSITTTTWVEPESINKEELGQSTTATAEKKIIKLKKPIEPSSTATTTTIDQENINLRNTLFVKKEIFCIHDQQNCQDPLCNKCFREKLINIPQNCTAIRIDFSNEIFRLPTFDSKTYQNFIQEMQADQTQFILKELF